jgi:hypothetical protein
MTKRATKSKNSSRMPASVTRDRRRRLRVGAMKSKSIGRSASKLLIFNFGPEPILIDNGYTESFQLLARETCLAEIYCELVLRNKGQNFAEVEFALMPACNQPEPFMTLTDFCRFVTVTHKLQ